MLTCARQILRAHDRADAIALLEQEHPPRIEAGASRILFPFQSSSLAAGQSDRAFQKNRRVYSFRPERLILGGSAEPRLGSSWRVDDIFVNGKSQFGVHGKLPSELFSNRVTGGIHVFDLAVDPILIEVEVTRLTGEGHDFLLGAVLGSGTYEPRTVRLQSDTRVRAKHTVRVGRVCEQSIDLNRFVILEDASDWIVSDILIDNASQFAHSGDIPGELFTDGSVDNFVRFGTVAVGSRVEVIVSYVGADSEGRVFSAELRGQEPIAHDPIGRIFQALTE